MAKYGIDVSEVQGNICWNQVKQDGVQFAILRAGYGAGDIDVQFRKNAEGCVRENIPFGVYWLSYAYTSEMARREAESCIETVEEYSLSYPVCFVFGEEAVKYAGSKGVSITKGLAAELVEGFCNRVKEKGYLPMFYSSKEFLNEMFEDTLCKKYPLWYAQYEKVYCSHNAVIWQYTNEGSVRGIVGHVNKNKAI